MSSNRLLASVCFISALLLLRVVPAFAQESGPSVHRLSWQPVEYVSRYEVTVEARARTSAWVEVLRRVSERETFVDCPLFVGFYRFRVSVYDLLGNPASSTDWVYFEVKTAAREETTPSPVQPAVLPEQTQQAVEQALQAAEQTQRAAAEIQQTAAETYRKVEEMEQSMEKLRGEMGQMQSPAEESPVPEKTGFRLEIIAQPLIILPFSDFNEIYATSPVQPLGFGLRFSMLSFTTPVGIFGFELNPSWNFLANDILVTSRYTHIFNAHLSLVWFIQPFSPKTGVSFRIGGGATYLKSRFDFNQGSSVAKRNTWNPSVAGGASFVFFLNSRIFFNAGLDYLHILTNDNATLNYLRPTLGLGWQF